jgi:cation transport ATPase
LVETLEVRKMATAEAAVEAVGNTAEEARARRRARSAEYRAEEAALAPRDSSTDSTFGLVFGLAAILVALAKLIEPHTYPPGDPRNETVFWLAIAAAGIGLGLGWITWAAFPSVRNRHWFRRAFGAINVAFMLVVGTSVILPGIR